MFKFHKTYAGAAVVALGGLVGLFHYQTGSFIMALGFAAIFIGIRHAMEKLSKGGK